MQNCILKALNRTLSTFSVNFSSHDNTVTVVSTTTPSTPQQKNNIQNFDEQQQYQEEPSPGAIKSSSSTVITSTPKNAQKTMRHHSTPYLKDCFELNNIRRALSSENDELKIKCLAEISGDICESFEEADVFSDDEEEHDDEKENVDEKFVFDDWYWEDDIRQYFKQEDENLNVVVSDGPLLKSVVQI
uniref:Uncharacterized protein n=1 Tax=Panagrolaimus sp. ES5 TaxID=591445 RepID=A0AC34G6Z7_9BILA